jgi:multiple sugar transport system substrate-binding protein
MRPCLRINPTGLICRGSIARRVVESASLDVLTREALSVNPLFKIFNCPGAAMKGGLMGPRMFCCLLGAMLLLVLGSCDRGVGGDGPITIRFWNGFTGPDGRTMLRLVQRFNRENPDVHVIMQRMEWGTYYNKLFVAGLGGRGPEVFVAHTDSLARFTRAGFVRPIDDLLVPGGVDPDDIDANVLSAVERDGKHYALPLDIHLLGMYYNRALFREAGIVDEHGEARPPTNRVEFLEALKKLQLDRDGDGRADTWGFVFTWLRTNCYTMMRQWGGELFSEDFTRSTLDSPANIEALQFCANLIRQWRLAPGPENFDAWIGFRQGRVGIAFEGIYMLPDLLKQKDLDYGAAPLPVLGLQPATWANSHNLCLRSDLEGRELEAGMRFIRFLSDNSLDWAEGGQVPVRKSLRQGERFQRMDAQREFARQIPHAAYMPQVPFVTEYLREYEDAVERALRGSATPQAALGAAKVRIERVIARYQRAPAPTGGAREVVAVESLRQGVNR